MSGVPPLPFRVFANPRAGTPATTVLDDAGFRRARAEITAWPGYAPTPLRGLPWAATAAGVAGVWMKDEAGRFGLGSFKALGGAYAVKRVLEASGDGVTVTCATDGNHGRSVAWGARRFGCRCVIFVHATVSRGRIEAIARHGAEVRVVPGTYDDAVREAARVARESGWVVVSDTSWHGYTDVPIDVMQGYRLMVDEAADQWPGAPPSHAFVQGGVGGVAAAVTIQVRARYDPPPETVVVEPDRAACLLASAEAGTPTAVPGDLDTLMAGLACGEPSLLAWRELERGAAAFMAIPDEAAVAAMRLLARHGHVVGESGVAGLAGLLLAATDPAARATLNLNGASRVLLFGTEGASDPDVYATLVGDDT
jgi:diaminopropionate ammonia-lyase